MLWEGFWLVGAPIAIGLSNSSPDRHSYLVWGFVALCVCAIQAFWALYRNNAHVTQELLEQVRAGERQRHAVAQELSDSRDAKPNAVATFRRDGNDLFLDVRNDGAIGEFWADISASGSILPLQRRRCAWTGTREQAVVIPKGDTATIPVAALDVDNALVGVCKWNVFYATSPGLNARILHQHSHGFGPDGVVDADISISLVVASRPDMPAGVITRRLRIIRFTTTDVDSSQEISY